VPAKLLMTGLPEYGQNQEFLDRVNYSTTISKKKEANLMIGLFLL